MDEKTGLGIGILGAALALGGLGDLLLRETPWGVNFLLWVVALVGAATMLALRAGSREAGEARWLGPVAVLFAACVAWRDAPMLVVLNVLAVLVSLSLAASLGRSGASLRLRGVSEYVLGGIFAGARAWAGPLPLAVKDVRWREVGGDRWRGEALAVTRGAFIAAPLLLVFGALLMAADAAFEDLVVNIFSFDVAELFDHLVLILFLAWVSAGLLWVALLARNPEGPALRRPETLSLGAVEEGVVLGLLNTLFLAFVTVQVRYLFGGAQRVAVAQITYAEYARRGFGELVVVTALVLPVLLVAHWMLWPEGRAGERVFRALAGTTVALLFVIMASAVHRMYLYTREFGRTGPRLYATVFIAWIAIVLLWFVLTVLRERRDRFAFGALATGLVTVLLLNAVNPDAVIAQTNISRMERGERFDPYHLTYGLSADAVPTLMRALPSIGDRRMYVHRTKTRSGEVRVHRGPTLEKEILNRWKRNPADWRGWNFGRWRAQDLVADYLARGENVRAP